VFESHFGFSAPPFQLNPDPTFYFGSKGHSNALAYLQYGVHQAEGFIVVTGEIGAGKTTLVRTLLEGLDSSQVKAAQIASTQLDATGLLQAMLTAFGVPHQPGALSKASLISTLEAFFMTLAIKNKRALLVVDEAQNLSMEAIEELRMLSNFQLRKQALLQSFLVGQPELRGMLESQRLEQLRQRVIASCHLGPLDPDETRRYIEHRLNRVGWTGNPAFDDGAFPRIHQATGGVPRRINLLCNRLLLSAFLENLTQITEAHVHRINQELRAEVGETTVVQVRQRAEAVAAKRQAAAPAPQQVVQVVEVQSRGVASVPAAQVQRIVRREVDASGRTVMCLVDSPATYLNASLLASALEYTGVASRVVVVGVGSAQHLGPVENYADVVDLPAVEVHLGVGEGSAAQRTADAVLRCEALLDEFLPDLLIPMGLSDEVVSCSLLASRNALPILRVGAGVRPSDAFEPSRLNASLLDRMANVLYAPAAPAALALGQDGVNPERVHVLGSLTHDGLAAANSASPLAPALMTHHGLTSGFVLITARVGRGRLSLQSLSKLVLMLSRVRGDRPVLWLVCGETQSALRAQGLGTVISRSGIALASMPVFSARLSILQRAACLVTDVADDLIEVCMSLGTPLLLLDEEDIASPSSDPRVVWLPLSANEIGVELCAVGSTPVQAPPAAAPSAAEAMAHHLEGWLSRREAGDSPASAPAPLDRLRQKAPAS
jgi:putative secretion ATPase (PEP-CTERM system associated)